ncbi:MAG: M28 family peptidase [Erysipelotrichales bacterium]|nr:M28 family peptidase [Erysipelotrichales bacterium]
MMNKVTIDNVTKRFNRRMKRKDKDEFLEYVKTFAAENSYPVVIEKNTLAQNAVVGSVRNAKYIFTAHYDTPPAMPAFLVKNQIFFLFIQFIYIVFLFVIPFFFPLFIRDNAILRISLRILVLIIGFIPFIYIMGFMGKGNKNNYNDNSSGVIMLLEMMEALKDAENRNDYCFVFFDNEEKGLFGSKFFQAFHRKKLDGKNIINLDCVGIGDNLNVYGNNPLVFQAIRESAQKVEGFDLPINSLKMKITKASDHYTLRRYKALMLCLETKKKKRFIMENIHTSKDTVLELDKMEKIKEILLGLC